MIGSKAPGNYSDNIDDLLVVGYWLLVIVYWLLVIVGLAAPPAGSLGPTDPENP